MPNITKQKPTFLSPLSPLQLRAAELLAMGMSITNTAKQVNRCRETVSGWQNDPKFAETVRSLLQEARETAKTRLQALVEPALAALEKDLMDEDSPRGVRQRAALAVLDRAGFGPSQALELSGGEKPVELELLSRDVRVELYERLLKGEGPAAEVAG